MKRLLALLLCCVLLSGCTASAAKELTAPKLSANPSNSEAVNTALASFGLELLQKTREEENASVLVSPLSVALALSMTANGADGETLAQFQEVLGGGADLVELNAACAQLMQDYQSLGGTTKCSIANSLWLDPEGQIKDEFVGNCRGVFDAQVFQAELSDAAIVKPLNDWVSKHTHKLIPKLIDQPFGEDVACLLVNALYLKNGWLRSFDPYCTHEMDFHTSDNSVVSRDFMQHFDATLSCLQGEDAQGVVLPYDDGRLAFFALMPDLYPDSPSLDDWLSSLDGGGLSWLLDTREDAFFLRFAMPKFEQEWTGSLKEILPQLGLEDAFDPMTADFSKLGDNPDGYYLSQVVHAAKIEVNEKGTEAAAATLAAPAAGSPMPDPEGITLILDRPFLYGIVDLHTGVPLFLGTCE